MKWPLAECDQPGDRSSAVAILACLRPTLQFLWAAPQSTQNPTPWRARRFQACSRQQTLRRGLSLQLYLRRISKNKKSECLPVTWNPSSRPSDIMGFGVPLQSTCTNSGKTKWEPWLNWDVGFGGPDDFQVRTAQVMMCNRKKLN